MESRIAPSTLHLKQSTLELELALVEMPALKKWMNLIPDMDFTVLQEHLKCNSVCVCTPGFVTFGLILVVLLSIDLSGFCTLATLSLYS